MSYASTYGFTVEHVSGVTTQLSDAQTVFISQGRSNLSDSYRSATMKISGRKPENLPTIKVGDLIQVSLKAFNNGVAVTLPTWESIRIGRVSNIEFDYGVIAPMDTWTITTEDAMAVLGRAVVSLTVTAGTVSSAAAKQITDAAGVTMTVAAGATSTTVKATTFDKANALDAFQTYANTEMAFVVQQGDDLKWIPRQGWTYTGSNVTFSDEVPGDPSYLDFQGLTVGNVADTVAQEVVVSIRDGNSVSTGAGTTYLDIQTYDNSNSQALDLGNYIKALFTNEEPVPFQLSYMLTGQDPEAVLGPVATELRQVNVNYRGNQTQAIVMGFTISITPDVARATLNLLDIDQIPLFQLDIPSNGVLNTNVLGY
jgi:hypothetical protein